MMPLLSWHTDAAQDDVQKRCPTTVICTQLILGPVQQECDPLGHPDRQPEANIGLGGVSRVKLNSFYSRAPPDLLVRAAVVTGCLICGALSSQGQGNVRVRIYRGNNGNLNNDKCLTVFSLTATYQDLAKRGMLIVFGEFGAPIFVVCPSPDY